MRLLRFIDSNEVVHSKEEIVLQVKQYFHYTHLLSKLWNSINIVHHQKFSFAQIEPKHSKLYLRR